MAEPQPQQPERLAFVLIDGVGDVSIPQFGFKTPLQVADVPHLDAIAGTLCRADGTDRNRSRSRSRQSSPCCCCTPCSCWPDGAGRSRGAGAGLRQRHSAPFNLWL